MSDFESLCAELDDFTSGGDIIESTIRDPEDLREAQQRYGIYELKNLARVLEKLQDPSNNVTSFYVAG